MVRSIDARVRLALLASAGLLLGVFFVAAGPGGFASGAAREEGGSPPGGKITRALRDELSAGPGSVTRYIVVLKEQAEVENDIVDWIAKGRFVYERLRQTADATQPPVAAFLGEQVRAGNVDSFESYYIINAFQVRGNLASAEALASLAAVSQIDVFPIATLDAAAPRRGAALAQQAVDWNVALVKAPEAWALGYDGAGVTIGSIDTGVRYTHNTLVNKYRGKLAGGGFDHNYNWWDAVYGQPAPHDPVSADPSSGSGHGTHTMGTAVGGDALNRIGVAPGASWIASNGVVSGTDTVSGTDIIESAQFMLAPWDLDKQNANPDKRPHVVANSWGWGSSVPYPGCSVVEFLHDMVRAWRAAGIFPSWSAGNAFPQGNRPPAAYPETFETGALRNPFAGLPQRASYSSIGPSCYDGGQLPQLMAGGGDAGFRLEDLVRSAWNTGDDQYSYQAGTSMAQPATAGAVAILKQVNPNLTISQTWHILTSTTFFDPAWATECGARPNYCYGWGLLQIDAAVLAARKTIGGATATGTAVASTATATTAASTSTATNTPGTGSTPTRTGIPTSVPPTRTPTAALPTNTALPSPTACALTTAENNTPISTIDGGTPVTSTITIANSTSNIAYVEVFGINIAHTYAGDLALRLIAPDGTAVLLFDDVCGSQPWSADEANFTLSDGAAAPIGMTCPPGNGTYRPEQPLAAFAGKNANGVWSLVITDRGPGDTGTLNHWGLRIAAASCVTGTPTSTPAGSTPTGTATTTSTATGTASQTSTRTSTATAAATASLTTTVTNTSTATSTRTSTRTSTATAAATASLTTTATNTATATSTRTSTAMPSATASSSSTPSPTATPRVVTPTPAATRTPCTISFADVGHGDYFYEGVRYLTCAGAISGYNDNTFRPYNEATRAQLVKIVVVAEGFPLAGPATPTFRDVPAGHPFFSWIETAAARQIIGGYEDGTFKPYNPVTRGQIAKIVVVAEGWDLIDPVEPTFVDVPPGSAFYVFVETAHLRGAISGYEDRTFRWYNNATRGQIAKIVHVAVTQP